MQQSAVTHIIVIQASNSNTAYLLITVSVVAEQIVCCPHKYFHQIILPETTTQQHFTATISAAICYIQLQEQK